MSVESVEKPRETELDGVNNAIKTHADTAKGIANRLESALRRLGRLDLPTKGESGAKAPSVSGHMNRIADSFSDLDSSLASVLASLDKLEKVL